jgi:cadherin
MYGGETKMGVSYTKLASVVAVAAVVGAVVFHSPVNAAPATFTWTGAAGDHKMATAGNWKEGSVPTAGSKLVFKCVEGNEGDKENIWSGGLSVAVSGLEVKKLDSLPNNKSCVSYKLNDMVFTPDAEFTGDFTSINDKDNRKIPHIEVHNYYGLKNMKSNGFDGEISYYAGGLQINRLEIANTGYNYIECQSTNYSTRAAEKIAGENANVRLNGANNILIKNKGQLGIGFSDETSASKITFENGAMISRAIDCADNLYSRPGAGPDTTTVLSGDIVLNGDVEYKLPSNMTVKITGKLSGPGKFVAHRDNEGNVLVESSNNTSGTPNGRYGNAHEPKLIKLDGDRPNDILIAKRGETVLLNGRRKEVWVNEGGAFGGDVAMSSICILGVVSPGNNSPGKITVSEYFDIEDGGVYKAKILNKDHYDQTSVEQSVNLNGGSLDLTYLEGGVIKKGDTFTIIDNKGPISVQGTFKDLPEGAEITAGGVTFKISYVGGDGNDIVLTALNDWNVPKASKAPKVPNTGGEKLAVNLIGTMAGVASAVALLVMAKRKNFNKK